MYQGIDFYNLTQQLAGAIFGAMGVFFANADQPPADPPPPLLQLRRGQAESPAWFLVQAAEFAPETISVAKLRVRDIYASERIVAALLELMASEKWLEPVAPGEYELAADGRQLLDNMTARPNQALAHWESRLDNQLLRQIAGRFTRLISASLEAGPPPGNWSLRHSRNRAPGHNAPLLAQILHATSDFNAYRDDAHMAAWQPLDVDGYIWEAFSFVYDGVAITAEQIDRQLFYRGYSRREYAAALENLAQRGWLRKKPAGEYHTTPLGRQIHEEAEVATNAYFYAPWAILSAEVVSRLSQAITQLMATLQER